MLQPIVVLTTLFSLIVLSWLAENTLSYPDIFSPTSSHEQITGLDNLSAQTLSRLKVASTTNASVGIFGNSRVVEVGNDDINHVQCTVFNYAVPGESYRNSISLARWLAEEDRLPSLSIISIDHFELQFTGSPKAVSPVERWHKTFRDIRTLDSPNLTISEKIKMIWRPIYAESLIFQQSLNADFILNKLSILVFKANRVAMDSMVESGYRHDGSRNFNAVPEIPEQLSVRSQGSSIIPQLLINDLQQLAALKSKGYDFIVYESPIEPNSAKRLSLKPSTAAIKTRNTFINTCNKLGLTCLAAPENLPGTTPWHNADHAPKDRLGAYISKMVSGIELRCKQ